MQNFSCPKCGFKRDPGAVECPRCGIIFEKYEQIQQRKSQQQKEQKPKNEESPPAPPDFKPFPTFPEPKAVPHLNCNACGSKETMAPTRIYKFGGIVRFIGHLIVIPSICGVFFAGILIASVGGTSSGAGAIMGFGLAVFVAAGSLISGLIGWLLIMKKKVFKCTSCGFILDRD